MGSKGFMHALEGIIAALLLLTYATTVFQYPPSYSEWTEVRQKQVSREYLSSFNDAGLSGLIVENRPAEFIDITRYFLGVRYSYGLYTEGLVPQNLIIGVLSNESVAESTTIDPLCAASGVPSEYDCYEGTFKGHKFVLVDNDTGMGNLVEDYDSIYFDSDNNGTYDKYEGPKSVSNAINVSGEMWIFSSIHNGAYDVEFIRGEDILKYRKKISSTLKINNRQTNISVRARTNESEIIDLDVLIIPGYMNLVHPKMKRKLNEFLDNKKSIIEVANITKDNLDEVQRDIFGLQSVDFDTVPPAESNIFINPANASEETYGVSKYFYFTNMNIRSSIRYRKLNMSWIHSGPAQYDYNCYLPDSDIYLGYVNCTDMTSSCTTYTIDGIINYVNSTKNIYCKIGTEDSPDIYYYAEIDIKKRNYSALVVNTTGSGYDGVFIDLNRDRNLTNDGGRISAGDTFKIDMTNFTLRKISENGRYIEIRPVSEHKFADTYPGRLYSIHNDTEYIVLEQSTEYNSTTYSIGDMTTVITLGGAGCTSGLLTGSGYKKGSWVSRSFTITNISKGFNILNIDLNGNNICNDLDEGPFYTGDLVRVGPEYYRIDIASDGSKVDWTLKERWKVPSAIVNHKSGLRKTAWIRGTIASDDEWHILRSILLWSLDHKSGLVKSSMSSESVLVKSTFIENKDMFQPYKVHFRTG